MSTTIKSAGPETPLTIRDSTGVGVCIDIGDGWKGGYFTRADFLAAVETECNVRIVPADSIVIERGELPELDEGCLARSIAPQNHRSIARHHLALAEYIDAHPPVDEAQVEALANVIDASDITEFETCTDYARRLYLAGVRIKAAK